ncbi:MAG TPA: hypothetical protein VFU69_16550 [Ktedonobacterales bacterium]|nr:hypothetical protein [Ktedonobacterales bacterium]
MSTWTPFQSFWSSPWAASLRAACVWLKREPAPVVPDTPDSLAPGWIRPLCLQRQIGKAIAARIAWMRAHPDQAAFLYPEDSIPGWTRFFWTPYQRQALRSWSDEWLLFHFQLEVERLLRIMQTPPALIGEEDWTLAALGACGHLAQVYHEFTRRYWVRRVRSFVGDVLHAYVTWEGPRPAAPAPSAQIICFEDEIGVYASLEI